MPLILAIEPDRRQASQLVALARHPLGAEIVVADGAEAGLDALDARVPDLILTSTLLSPKDEAALTEWLRRLDAAASHVQTLTIPVLAAASRRPRAHPGETVFKRLRGRTRRGAPDGCDPRLFAEQIAEYLERAEVERKAAALAREAAAAAPVPEPEPAIEPAPVAVEQWAAAEPPAIPDPPVVLAIPATGEAPRIFAPEPLEWRAVDPPTLVESGLAPVEETAGEPELAAGEQVAAEEPIAGPVVAASTQSLELIATALEVVDAVVADPVETAPEPEAPIVIDVEMTPSPEDEIADSSTALEPDAGVAFAIELSQAEIEAALGELAAVDPPVAAGAARQSAAVVADDEPDGAEVAEPEVAPERPESWEARLSPLAPWPALEGVAAEPHAAVELPVVAEPPAIAGAPATATVGTAPSVVEVAVPAGTTIQQPENHAAQWMDALEQLRLEIDRLRVERAQPIVINVPAAPPAPAAPALNGSVAPVPPAPEAAPPVTAAPVAEPAAWEEARPSERERRRQATERKKKHGKKTKGARPIQDEWGFFDPDQCGFAALLEKLDEVTEEATEDRDARPEPAASRR